jgi:origin recognition complex subunit 5
MTKSTYAFRHNKSRREPKVSIYSYSIYTLSPVKMDTLSLLLSTPSPPPFIYIHHPHCPTSSLNFPDVSARVDGVECHTPKLLLSAILSRLEGKDGGLVDTLDTFIRRLRVYHGGDGKGKTKRKGKGKEKEKEGERAISIVITKAERLPRVLGSGWAVMTRLAELVSSQLCSSRRIQADV